MSSRRSMRAWYVSAAIGMLIIIQLFAVIVSGVTARNTTLEVAQDGIAREGDTTIESILRYLEPAEQSVEVTSRLIQNDLLDTEDSTLESYLSTQLAVLPQVTGAFVGFPDGAFVFVTLEDDGFRSKRIGYEDGREVHVRRYDASFDVVSVEATPDDEYDPRVRPWYEQSLQTPDVAWTDPYVFFTSGRPGVTASKAVMVDGEVEAVVGVDVELSGLTSFLDNLAISDEGQAFVVSGSEVLATPSDYELRPSVESDGSVRLPTVDELAVPALSQTTATEAVRVEGVDGTDLVLRREFPAVEALEWSLVIRAPESEFTDAIRDQQRLTLLIGLGGGLLVLLAALALIRLSRPIDEMQTLAEEDPLTGLANRRHVKSEGDRLLADEDPRGPRHALLVLDLDRFKQLNDEFGDRAGDRALVVIGRHLETVVGKTGVTGRLGGDEFAAMFESNNVSDANEEALRILLELTTIVQHDAPESAELTVSGGLAISDGTTTDFEDLLIEAHDALLIAKQNGAGTLRVARRLIASMR